MLTLERLTRSIGDSFASLILVLPSVMEEGGDDLGWRILAYLGGELEVWRASVQGTPRASVKKEDIDDEVYKYIGTD